jgi:glycosyltransferase involved in cell wall biosynthesis
MSKANPYFSVVIPLYNKQSHVKETIETVLSQTFQNFEIVVVNDGSKDDSVKIVQTIQDERIRIIHQENQGVSVARNNGIKEAKTEYIAFLDADDIWLPHYLQTIYNLTIDFPAAGMYATSYELVNSSGEHKKLNIQALPSADYIGIIPNYFKSVSLGDFIVWTSAVCIPRKIFMENNIWFPVGEKYGEDQHLFARIAMLFDIGYNTKICALYMIETENNTSSSIMKEQEPLNSILILKNYRNTMSNKELLNYFNKYIKKHNAIFISLNIQNNKKIYALKQIFKYELSSKDILKFLFIIAIPKFLYKSLKMIKEKIKG